MTRWSEDDLQKHLGRKPVSLMPSPARLKYGNRKTTSLDGVEHASGKEARRWQELQLLFAAGKISGLKRQVSFDLCVNGMLICRYIADAVYVEDGETKVEDTKSAVTQKLPVFSMKRKLMKAIHGIEIAIA